MYFYSEILKSGLYSVKFLNTEQKLEEGTFMILTLSQHGITPPPPHPSSSLKEHCNNALYKMLAHNIYGATIQLTIHILLFFSGGQSILMTIYNQLCQLQP